MTIYADMKATGVQIDNHESDLYVPVTLETSAVIRKWQHSINGVTVFKSNVDGQPWYDVPFMYEPFWNARAR